MRKRIFFLFYLCLVFSGISGKAQVSLGMGPVAYSYRDTVNAGDIDTFSVSVRNNSFTLFNDTITVVGAVRDIANSSVLHVLGSYTTYNAVTLPALDSITIPLTSVYNTSPNSYHAGINVIVIWPVANSATTVDSLQFTVFIIDASGIDELDLKQFVKTYPNPVTDYFNIENTGKINIEEVRIYDSTGKLIEIIKNQSAINTEQWPKGMYMLDMLFSNAQRHSVRIIKQ